MSCLSEILTGVEASAGVDSSVDFPGASRETVRGISPHDDGSISLAIVALEASPTTFSFSFPGK